VALVEVPLLEASEAVAVSDFALFLDLLLDDLLVDDLLVEAVESSVAVESFFDFFFLVVLLVEAA
jgi:hypothetical protein